MAQIWLITGAGHGLGRSIAEAALDAGDRVVATARDLAKLDDLVARFSDQVRAMSLDVTDEAQGQAAVRGAVEAFGKWPRWMPVSDANPTLLQLRTESPK